MHLTEVKINSIRKYSDFYITLKNVLIKIEISDKLNAQHASSCFPYSQQQQKKKKKKKESPGPSLKISLFLLTRPYQKEKGKSIGKFFSSSKKVYEF